MADEAARAFATADQERATIQREVDDLKNTVLVLSGQAARLTEQAAEARVEARRHKITSALSFVRSAAGRRSMKKLMEILFLVEDGEKVKRGLTVTVGMTVSEVDRVNRVIEEQDKILSRIKELVRAELGMQAVAAKSSFGWGLVAYMEADPDLKKEVHGLDIVELRALERRMMQHNRMLAAATRARTATKVVKESDESESEEDGSIELMHDGFESDELEPEEPESEEIESEELEEEELEEEELEEEELEEEELEEEELEEQELGFDQDGSEELESE